MLSLVYAFVCYFVFLFSSVAFWVLFVLNLARIAFGYIANNYFALLFVAL
jgi:hypothetical protein